MKENKTSKADATKAERKEHLAMIKACKAGRMASQVLKGNKAYTKAASVYDEADKASPERKAMEAAAESLTTSVNKFLDKGLTVDENGVKTETLTKDHLYSYLREQGVEHQQCGKAMAAADRWRNSNGFETYASGLRDEFGSIEKIAIEKAEATVGRKIVIDENTPTADMEAIAHCMLAEYSEVSGAMMNLSNAKSLVDIKKAVKAACRRPVNFLDKDIRRDEADAKAEKEAQARQDEKAATAAAEEKAEAKKAKRKASAASKPVAKKAKRRQATAKK